VRRDRTTFGLDRTAGASGSLPSLATGRLRPACFTYGTFRNDFDARHTRGRRNRFDPSWFSLAIPSVARYAS